MRLSLSLLVFIGIIAAGSNAAVGRSSVARLASAHREISAHVEGYLASYGLARTVYVEECYDLYIPQINDAAEAGKEESEKCVAKADDEKGQLEVAHADDRKEVQDLIDKVVANLNECEDNDEVALYLQCLIDTNTENKGLITEINTKSKTILKDVNAKLKEIEKDEKTCVEASVKAAKQATDALFDKLQDCVVNGTPAPDTS